jgi:hypothetical protein
MAINFAQMLLQPTKATPWDLSPSGAGTAREQLKLAREKFEFDQKRAEEEDRLAREKQGAEMARARLEAEATKAAKLQEDRLKVYGEFTKATGEGNVEAARAMVPMMHSLGMDIGLEGEEGGLPRYRVGMDAAEAEEQEAARLAQASPYGDGETAEQSLSRLGAMGLGGETGSLLPPLGIRASDEVDPTTGASVADRVAATYGTPGEKTATRGPDTEDFTGGVPKNVIDMGASAAATLHRLDPSLKAAAAAYPDEQTSAAAEQLRLGLRGTGLPLEKQMAAFDKAVSGPASQRNAQIGADAQKERFRETRDELTETQAFAFEKAGRDDADKFATDNKVHDVGKALRAGDTILDVLDDKDPNNDAMIASELMTFQNVKGTPSDTDLKLAFDIPMSTTMDQALNIIGKMVKGGMQPVQKDAIKAYIATKKEELERGAFEYLDQAHARASGGAYNERAKKAYLQTVKGSVQGSIYNKWLDMKKARDEGSAGKSAELGGSGKAGKFDPDPVQGDFDIELESLAMESDLDPEKIKAVMGPESGGKADARNPKSGATGLIQFLPSIARDLGTSTEELASMSATEQLPFVMKYLSDRGVTSDSPTEDYVMAVAAPAFIGKPPETVVYRKGSKEWEQNPAWRPPGGGDITVASIGRFYQGGGKGGTKATEPAGKSPLDKSVLDILRRAGD